MPGQRRPNDRLGKIHTLLDESDELVSMSPPNVPLINSPTRSRTTWRSMTVPQKVSAIVVAIVLGIGTALATLKAIFP